MQDRAFKCISVLVYLAAAAGILWLTLNFILPWAAPFLVALALAAAMEPAVRFMCSRGIKRSFAAGILSIAMLALALWGLFALGSYAVSETAEIARQMPELMGRAGKGMEDLERSILSYVSSVPASVQDYMKTAVDAAGESLYSLPGHISGKLLDFLTSAARKSPSTLLFIVTSGIGTYFLSASFPDAAVFISAQLSDKTRKKLRELSGELRNSLGGFLRAQLILMAMSFFQLLAAFLLLEVKGAFGIAAVTALIDALPVFGTGTVLIPWALYCLLLGNYGRALGLAVTWALVNLVRSCAQAKLLGDQIGLNPIVSLAAVYIGWKVMGVRGMLLFPLAFSVLQQLNSRGIVKLWKNV